MLLFILLPLISVILQSVHTPHEAVLVTVENCGPFGCKKETTIDQDATRILREAEPLGRFVGFDIYFDRAHLAVAEVRQAWISSESWGVFFNNLGNLPFYRAMAFTLTFTFTVTPILIVFGLMIALGVNAISEKIKGLVIFVSLLPMIVTPLIGSLILFWMIDSRGILGNASTGLTWVMLIVYGVWHSAPFAFVVFYAGLQTLPMDQIESARIDGASRWEQVRYVIIPHLMPLITFVALIQLMDNFRVFEPIVGFNAAAHATSLSWIIFNDLGGETRQLSAAATSSMLTIFGVAILLSPILWRTWQDFKGKS